MLRGGEAGGQYLETEHYGGIVVDRVHSRFVPLREIEKNTTVRQ